MNFVDLYLEIAKMGNEITSLHTRAVVAHAVFGAEQRHASAQFGSKSPELAAVEAETERVTLELLETESKLIARFEAVKRLTDAFDAFREAEKSEAGREALLGWLTAKRLRTTTLGLTDWMKARGA